MWAHLASHWMVLLLDDTTPTTAAPASTGSSSNLITVLASTGGVIVVGYLGYLGNRSRNRATREDERQADKDAGAVNFRLGALEGDRDDELEARRIVETRLTRVEATGTDHDTRIAALEQGAQVVAVPASHPSRRRPKKSDDDGPA